MYYWFPVILREKALTKIEVQTGKMTAKKTLEDV
jgi:hypothetical protein